MSEAVVTTNILKWKGFEVKFYGHKGQLHSLLKKVMNIHDGKELMHVNNI